MSRRNQDSKAGRATVIGTVLLLTAVTVAAAHDMFLKPTRFFAPENAEVRVRLLNGTFTRSENSIARNRLADASVLTPPGGSRSTRRTGKATGDTSHFSYPHARRREPTCSGSRRGRASSTLSADDFNLYLKDDGIPDVLAARTATGELGKGARERYHKHVKALVQVGDTAERATTPPRSAIPAEIIPIEQSVLAQGRRARCASAEDDGGRKARGEPVRAVRRPDRGGDRIEHEERPRARRERDDHARRRPGPGTSSSST